ncbi:MAG: ABC transporter substrate binding protein [Pseudomonadota bacterium]
MKNYVCYCILAVISFLLPFLSPGKVHGAPFKVLVVMSYDEAYAWEKEIREGIKTVLGGNALIKYIYMDTKNRLENGPERAREAYKLFQEFQPDGVIAADDNAQSMFVVPYLKDKVATPVMFCGVNAALETYGFPTTNVSGISERLHIGESLAFAQQLIPSIKKVAYIQKDSPSARAVEQQFLKESANYPVQSVDFQLPKTLSEAKKMVEMFKDKTDALFFETMEGIPDDDGTPLNDRTVIPILAKIFGKPIISNNLYHVEYGTLCAVIKTGQEQGEVAAQKLLEAMQGKPIAEIPVAMNKKGRQVLNVTVMDELDFKPKPYVLKGVKLVKTIQRFKVLVVMSYEEDFPWDIEVKEGIESALGYAGDIRYFYMDTKKNLPGGLNKGKEAYRLYRDFQPDGVIAADDNAQTMFVVPYLKDKVETPVMFCGVNADPGQYGYPAVNVSGILERGHIKESIAFLQELVPSVKTMGYMAKQSPTGKAVMEQVENEAANYSAELVGFFLPKTLSEALTMAIDMKDRSDAMMVATMQGIPDNNDVPLSEKEVIPLLAKTYGKPIITDNVYNMKYGMLCAVAVSGQEQGAKASKMLIKAMQGAPVAKIPIIRNERGRRIINVSAMKALGITPKPSTLLGVELIKTED